MTASTESVVRVEVAELDAGGPQISDGQRATELLRARAHDIRCAIREASEIAMQSLDATADEGDWCVKSLVATFGLTLTAETGVIVTKASAGASFAVTLTVERISSRE